MPYITDPKYDSYSPEQTLPLHLDHKPVYALPYEKFDVIHEDTDVRYISIGIAQYDLDHVSIKTMRHTGEKWTRQAEELPLHRVIDMTIFLAKVLFGARDDGVVIIPRRTFCRQEDAEIQISRETGNGALPAYDDFLSLHRDKYKARLNVLFEVLRELKLHDKI